MESQKPVAVLRMDIEYPYVGFDNIADMVHRSLLSVPSIPVSDDNLHFVHCTPLHTPSYPGALPVFYSCSNQLSLASDVF